MCTIVGKIVLPEGSLRIKTPGCDHCGAKLSYGSFSLDELICFDCHQDGIDEYYDPLNGEG